MFSALRVFLFLTGLHFSLMASAQEILQKGSLILSGEVGISFYNSDLRYSDSSVMANYNLNDALRFTLIPQLEYAFEDRLFVAGHLGFNFSNYKRQNSGFRLQALNLKTGVSLKYYLLEITDFLFVYSELGLSLNFYSLKQGSLPLERFNNTLITSNFDLGLTLFAGPEWMISLVFKDLISYHSDTPNFEHLRGLNTGSPFKDFIRFPHFSIAYKLK